MDAEDEGGGTADPDDEGAGEEEEEAEDGVESMESSDEEDDTAERFAVCGEAPPEPPTGFRYVQACPELVTLDHKRALVGRKVLTARVDDGACGWFLGTIVSDVVGKRDKAKVPTATHIIEFKQKETGTKQLAWARLRRSSPLSTTARWSGGFCSSQCHRGPLEPAFWDLVGTICVVFCVRGVLPCICN